ncbi:DinB family protein [Paenibacillus protaetiae]|uniref:Damage-inducible protein DinB n=1 Tax=Paenibacillus protaetiae TaxID=2509456 RepID=A0A4P6EUR2_9BACL|nr:DinB family protein [Paenibacillus protaetiae]QAY66722.1 damage-inducible protein DinB [Paenibacillus protaetiae]
MDKAQHPALKLYSYHVWANDKLFGRLRELPHEVYTQELTSIFPTIETVMKHMYTTDLMWLEVMKNTPFPEVVAYVQRLREEAVSAGFEEMEERFKHGAGLYEDFLGGSDLDKPITVTHPQYGALETRLSELVQHVVNHGTYHRGNVAAMIRQQGHAGVSTDYVFYIYEQ